MAARNWQQKFINELAESSNVKKACGAAGISQSLVYETRRKDAQFARQWYAALAEGYDTLEMDLLNRLREGRLEDKDDEGKVVAKFDVGTAFRCLAAHRDTVAKERGRQTLEGELTTMKAINEKIDALQARKDRAAELEARRKEKNRNG